jgi:hypothetical protein
VNRLRALIGVLAVAAAVSAVGGAATTRTADTSITATFTRGAGTELNLTVKNNGPDAARAIDNSGNVTGGFSLGLDQWSSGSTYMVASFSHVPKPWTCSSQYDVIYCSKNSAMAPGESVSFTAATNLCYPAGHAYKTYFFTGGNIGNNGGANDGTFSGGGGSCSTTHIGSLKVTISNKVREQSASLRQQVKQLDDQKEQIESTLGDKQAALQQAEAAFAAFEPKLPPIYAAIEETRSFLAKIGAAEGKLTPGQRAELQARDSLDATIGDLQGQIVTATGSGKPALAKSLQGKLDRDEGRLQELIRSLRGSNAPVDQLREKWLSKLRMLNDQLFKTLNGQALADQARAQAAADLQRALDARASLDDQLLALAKQIFQIDVALGNVLVTAGSAPPPDDEVWKANVLGSVLQTDQIDQDLAALAQEKDALASLKNQAADRYMSAEQQSIAALDNVTTTIMSTAYRKAAVDFISNALDVIKAAKNGGLIGASAETLKKVVETLSKEYLVDRGQGRWGSKGAVEFDSDLAKNISNAVFAKAGGKMLAERAVKELGTKTAKDALNRKLGTLVFAKVYGSVPPLYQQVVDYARSGGNPGVELIRQMRTAADGRTKQLLNLADLNPKTRWEQFGDLGVTLLKDAAKTTLKAHFDVVEQQAWIAYFEAETLAQMAFPLWQATADAYWKAYDAYNDELEQKAKVLEGYDPTGHFKVMLQKEFFANDPVSVLFSTTGGDSYTPIKIEVYVDGQKADRYSGGTWVVSEPHFNVTAKGVPLEIRIT